MIFQAFRQIPARFRVIRRRAYTTPSAQHSIYISNSTNPYFNLTFEDWLFRHKAPEGPLLLIYRDDPCVIIGRNQNPWKEVNFKALRERPGIPFIRRRSGGGTVYHDLGNTNFSIHLPREEFDRHATAQVVLRAVRSLGIDARVNDRNDICVGQNKMSVDTMITRGVASVRSPVCNLQQYSRELTHDTFANAVVLAFQNEYGITSRAQIIDETDELRHVEYIRKGLEELPSWDWAYGQTPEFTYTVDHNFGWGRVTADIHSKHGFINTCKFSISDTRLEDFAVEALAGLGQTLEGKRYGSLGDLPAAREHDGPSRDILTWMKDIMET